MAVYHIIGGDGREYGPVGLEQLRHWAAQGRISLQTRVRAETSSEWKAAADLPEVQALFRTSVPGPPGTESPPVIGAPAARQKASGLAVLSFILGLASFGFCLTFLTGIPAIICGHIARRRVAHFPTRYGGAGLAATGLVLGYASIIMAVVIAAMVLPALPKASRVVPRSNCQRNLREIGLAFKVWALDHHDQYPFNVSTNEGGTRELCAVGADGFDKNALAHFMIISNELSTPNFLVCPNDKKKHAALNFDDLRVENVSYQLRTGTNINSDNPQEVLAVCPIHGNTLYSDGNVRAAGRPARR